MEGGAGVGLGIDSWVCKPGVVVQADKSHAPYIHTLFIPLQSLLVPGQPTNSPSHSHGTCDLPRSISTAYVRGCFGQCLSACLNLSQHKNKPPQKNYVTILSSFLPRQSSHSFSSFPRLPSQRITPPSPSP